MCSKNKKKKKMFKTFFLIVIFSQFFQAESTDLSNNTDVSGNDFPAIVSEQIIK